MPNPGRTFDPNTPTELQVQDWTCAIRSTMWMLESIGIPVTAAEAQDAMSPEYVNSAVGLLDASGAGIVEVLADHWGVESFNDGSATFDEVASKAGKMPVSIGLRNWGGQNLGHWSAVRGVDGERLVLANPAGTGPVYGQQTLTRQEFDARGPASMVVVPIDAAAPGPTPSAGLRGIDVASWQGNPDWDEVAASGIAFAITKVTEDDGYLNPTFARNWREITRVGMIRGAYHFARPEQNDAVTEADYFLSMIDANGGLAPGDLLVLDIEAGSGNLAQWTLDFLHRVEQRAGVKPFVYTGAWFSGPHGLASRPEIGAFPLWLAAYTASMPAPPAPWGSIAIWQHSDQGQVPGIVGNVDMNRFAGTREELIALGKPGGEPMPTPRVVFDPSYPRSVQDDEWSCAPTSLDQAMRSVGKTPGNQWIENDMLRLGYVTTARGLMNHTGAGIVEWVSLSDAAHYGSDGFGISNNQNPIGWDMLVPEINPHAPYPILLGLPNWDLAGGGHWAAIRGFSGGKIQLANPANGATFGHSELTRAQFDQRAAGNASIVRVLHPDLLAPAPPDPPDPPPVALTREEIVAELTTIRADIDELIRQV